MTRTITWTMTMLLAGIAGCSTEKAPPPAPPTVATSVTREGDTIKRTDLVTAQATVVKVDKKDRMVTLRAHDGQEFTVHADERVKNFAQIHKGDEVNATYYQAIAARLVKKGKATPGIVTGEGIETAKPGEMPAATGARRVQVTATVTKVDRDKSEVTLKGPRGRSVVVAVKDPDVLKAVKKGDLVEVTYTEALAISVEKPTS